MCKDCILTDSYFAEKILGKDMANRVRGNQHTSVERTHCKQGHAIRGHNVKMRRLASGNDSPTCLICDRSESRVRRKRIEGRPITLEDSIQMTIDRCKRMEKDIVEDALGR